jgi:hypothetical protein
MHEPINKHDRTLTQRESRSMVEPRGAMLQVISKAPQASNRSHIIGRKSNSSFLEPLQYHGIVWVIIQAV